MGSQYQLKATTGLHFVSKYHQWLDRVSKIEAKSKIEMADDKTD